MLHPDPPARAARERAPGRQLDPVVVWGAGAMGGSIGASLIRAGHQVLFVDTDAAHAAAIRESGLRITGPVDAFTVRARCVSPDGLLREPAHGLSRRPVRPDGSGRPAADRAGRGGDRPELRTVLLCVKAHHTRAAMGRIAPLLAADGFVVSVQNGLNERVIGDAVGPGRVVGCFVNFGADVVEPGVVLRGNRGAVVVGELDGAETDRIRAVHALFRDFEPRAVLTDDIHGYLWGKLAYGSMLFATALANASIADVLVAPDHRPTIIALAREATAVAAARGVRPRAFDGFDPAAFAPDGDDAVARASLDRLVDFNRASAKSHSGVWRDLAVRRRKTEVDAQIAPIAELGAAAGVDTPLTRRLVELIHDVEEGRRDQGWETLAALGASRPV